MCAHSCGNRKALSSKIAILATDRRCDLRNNQWMARRNKAAAAWLKSEFERTGKKQNALASELEVNPAAINRMLKGTRKISADELPVIREFFGSEDDLAAPIDGASVPEVDLRGGMGGGGISMEVFSPDADGGHTLVDGVRDRWGIPPSYMRHELRATPRAIRIIEVMGDSMEPTLKSGDRLLIDTLHRMPSPPGIYAVWDGIGVVVKRVELVPKTEPMRVKLISDNKSHGEYEVTADEAQILGRVIAKVSTM